MECLYSFLLRLIERKCNSLSKAIMTFFENLKAELTMTVVDKTNSSVPFAQRPPQQCSDIVKNKTKPAVIILPRNQYQSTNMTKAALLENIDPVSENIYLSEVQSFGSGGVGCSSSEGNNKFR